MSYRSDTTIPQKTPDGLAEKIQMLGAYLLLPEERETLRKDPVLRQRIAGYLSQETLEDLSHAVGIAFPMPESPNAVPKLRHVGKKQLFRNFRDKTIARWKTDGRPETQTRRRSAAGGGPPWTVVSTEYLGKKNRVYLQNSLTGKTLLIHKSSFIHLWEIPVPTVPARKNPYPPNPLQPDSVEEPTNLRN